MLLSSILTGGTIAVGYYLSQDEETADNGNATSSKVAGQSTISLTGGSNVNNDLPGPDGFSEYEQFADQTSALFTDIEEGTGQAVTTGDTVAMLYQGWLTDGRLFDQSRTNDAGELEPFVFTLGSGQVISGWDQGIEGMKVGGKRRLVIPAVVGYGSTGQGSIPPNSMLIFDVELIQAQKAETTLPGL